MAYTPMTAEEKAKLTPAEIDARIADLEAAKTDLLTPVPQEYPKWVEIGGVNQVVESEEEEKKKKTAHDKATKSHLHTGAAGGHPTGETSGKGKG